MSSDPKKSELFDLSVLDLPDQIELVLQAKGQYLQSLLGKITRAERIKHLMQIASSSQEKYRDINDAFLYGILVYETNASNECFQLLHSIMQDHWKILCSQTRYFTFAKFYLLKPSVRTRLFWLVDKLVALQAQGADNLLLGLLRHIKGGDYSVETVELIQKLYHIFINHRSWYYSQEQLIQFSVYSFLRVIAGNGLDLSLRKDLSVFCSTVILEKFKECSAIGRDLIRVLQDVSALPEFKQVWKRLYQLSVGDSSIASTELHKILCIPTQKKFLASRLTPEMEFNLLFILDHVKYGGNHHRKYYDWYFAEYLKVSDADNIIIDIIRYLVVSYHPPNAVLASSSVQRWQIITWLLRLMRTNYSTANAKLALFYDWMFYDSSVDNIMNVEPAILIISKSASVNPKISCTMIEFLYLLKSEYIPQMRDQIERSIDKTMQEILSKRVIANLEAVLLAEQISDGIKGQLKELFPSYSNGSKLHISEDLSVSTFLNVRNKICECLNDPNAEIFNLSRELIEEIGSMPDSEYEKHETILVDLIHKSFNCFLDESKEGWANGIRSALIDSSRSKEVIDRSVERLALLPLADFNIESFLVSPSSPSVSSSLAASRSASLGNTPSMPSSKSSSSNDSFPGPDDEMRNGIEDQMRFMKNSDSRAFYSNCFTQFYQELSEAANLIDLIGVLLEDTDQGQLFQLKSQLLILPRNPLLVNWNNLVKVVHLSKDWDGYCQIFLWDLLQVCMKQIQEPFESFRELVIHLQPLLLSPNCQEEYSELCNGVVNLALSFYPKSPSFGKDFGDFVLILLEVSGDSRALLSILTFYWRINSRLFLQSLVRLDELGPERVNQQRVRFTLTEFSKTIAGLEEASPAKKSLLSCIETTIALMNK